MISNGGIAIWQVPFDFNLEMLQLQFINGFYNDILGLDFALDDVVNFSYSDIDLFYFPKKIMSKY